MWIYYVSQYGTEEAYFLDTYNEANIDINYYDIAEFLTQRESGNMWGGTIDDYGYWEEY
jgi:hypothetical protein